MAETNASKRARACDACHSIKIKCELGSRGGPPPCERCLRLGKECVITPPKRQKDRIAELEAQVAALTKQLESQTMQPSPEESGRSSSQEVESSLDGKAPSESTTSAAAYQVLPSKKRRLEEGIDAKLPPFGLPSETSFELDTVLSTHAQRRLFRQYIDEVMPIIPLIPITSDWNYARLREVKPILLQSLIYAASPGMLSVETQQDIASVILNLFATEALADRKKTLELVQAIQVTVLWYRAPKNHAHVAAFQLIQLACSVAEEIGLGGPQGAEPFGLGSPTEKVINSSDGWRTWFVCHLLSSSMSNFVRRPASLSWTEYEDFGCQMLAYSEYGVYSDKLLYQFVRAERLCERIVMDMNLCDLEIVMDVSDPVTQLTMQTHRNNIIDWKAQIPPGLNLPTVTFWEYVAILYLHETVLHTPSNKNSFSAPYLAERLSVTDFPTPFVTPEHITSIYALKTTCHQLLDLYAAFNLPALLALPSWLFAARVAYTEYILVKLYIATTGTGNTFGTYLDPESLLVEMYLDKMVGLGEMVKQADERCASARILQAAARMKEWVLNFKATTLGQMSNAQMSSSHSLAPSSTGEQIPSEWSNIGLSDDAFDFGLDDFFADPPMFEWLAGAPPYQNIPSEQLTRVDAPP